MTTRAPAGALLAHPASLAAIAVLVANDHWLKVQHPGVVSGKLSDAAGLVFFPLLLLAGVTALARVVGRRPPRFAVVGCALGTALVFTLVKSVPFATDVYRQVLGDLQWPLHAAWSVLRGVPVDPALPVSAVTDRTDLLTLPFVAVSVWIAQREGTKRDQDPARKHEPQVRSPSTI